MESLSLYCICPLWSNPALVVVIVIDQSDMCLGICTPLFDTPADVLLIALRRRNDTAVEARMAYVGKYAAASVVCTQPSDRCFPVQDDEGNVNWGVVIFSLLSIACGAVWLGLLRTWCALGSSCLSCPRKQQVGNPLHPAASCCTVCHAGSPGT